MHWSSSEPSPTATDPLVAATVLAGASKAQLYAGLHHLGGDHSGAAELLLQAAILCARQGTPGLGLVPRRARTRGPMMKM